MRSAKAIRRIITRRMELAVYGKRGVLQEGQYHAGQPLKIRRLEIGKLLLPSGRICVADAYSATEFPPLNILVPPGAYPVEVALAQFSKRIGSDRGAFLVVTFSVADIA